MTTKKAKAKQAPVYRNIGQFWLRAHDGKTFPPGAVITDPEQHWNNWEEDQKWLLNLGVMSKEE